MSSPDCQTQGSAATFERAGPPWWADKTLQRRQRITCLRAKHVWPSCAIKAAHQQPVQHGKYERAQMPRPVSVKTQAGPELHRRIMSSALWCITRKAENRPSEPDAQMKQKGDGVCMRAPSVPPRHRRSRSPQRPRGGPARHASAPPAPPGTALRPPVLAATPLPGSPVYEGHEIMWGMDLDSARPQRMTKAESHGHAASGSGLTGCNMNPSHVWQEARARAARCSCAEQAGTGTGAGRSSAQP